MATPKTRNANKRRPGGTKAHAKKNSRRPNLVAKPTLGRSGGSVAPMSDQSYMDKAVLEVKKRKKTATDVEARPPSPFLDGTLVIVDYIDDEQEEGDEEDSYYMFFHEDSIRALYYADDVIDLVKDRRKYRSGNGLDILF